MHWQGLEIEIESERERGREIFAIIIIILVLHTKAICHKPELELKCKTKNSEGPSVFNSWGRLVIRTLSIEFGRTNCNVDLTGLLSMRCRCRNKNNFFLSCQK